MAQVVNSETNTVKLNNGQTITAQSGGWYDGQQYVGGTLSAPGVINSQSNQQGAGQKVSNEVIAQTNPNNVPYVQQQQQTYQPSQNSEPMPGTAPANQTPTVSMAGGGSTGQVSSGKPTTGNLSATGAPTLDIQGITAAAYNTPEIKAANDSITSAQGELTARQQALATAQAGINDNPFYSEATRVGKSQQLTQQANADMGIIQNKITEAQGQVASLKADAAIKVNAAQGQYNINEQAYKDNLTQFNNLLTAGALDNASGVDIANLAVSTGIPTSMIQSMVSASQKKNNPVQLITSTDDAGNLTLLSVDSSGKVLNTATVNGVGTTKKPAGGTSVADQKASDTQTNTNNLITDVKNKVTLKSLIDHYSGALSIDDIYRYYNENSPWGAAKETLQQVKQGQFTD